MADDHDLDRSTKGPEKTLTSQNSELGSVKTASVESLGEKAKVTQPMVSSSESSSNADDELCRILAAQHAEAEKRHKKDKLNALIAKEEELATELKDIEESTCQKEESIRNYSLKTQALEVKQKGMEYAAAVYVKLLPVVKKISNMRDKHRRLALGTMTYLGFIAKQREDFIRESLQEENGNNDKAGNQDTGNKNTGN